MRGAEHLAGILAFLGLAVGLALAAVASAVALGARKSRLAGRIAQVASGGIVLYGALIVLVSALSPGRSLGLDEEKFSCQLDCDLAYSVSGVSTVKVIDGSGDPCRSRGTFYIVAVRVRSDAARVRMKPWTSPAQVVAADGRRFTISAAGQRALDTMRGEVVPLDQEVEPGASYVKELVFDIPDDVQRPQLLIADDDCLTRLVIGNENSLFHRKTTFRLS